MKRFWRLDWRQPDGEDVRFYAVAFGKRFGGKIVWGNWKVQSKSDAVLSQDIGEPYKLVAIRAVSKTGIVGETNVAERP